MSIPQYLAMTAADFSKHSTLPPHTAWMAVHFSASGQGLSNRPGTLPPGSLLILDDQTPWDGHSLETVCQEAVSTLRRTGARGLLLDFEREPSVQTLLLADTLARCCGEIGCAIGMPPQYLGRQPAAVFLPPLPCCLPPRRAVEPYLGRELWLEASPTGYRARIGADGVKIVPGTAGELEAAADGQSVFTDPRLQCRYYSRPVDGQVELCLYDTWDTLRAKLPVWETLGVTLTISVWRPAAFT